MNRRDILKYTAWVTGATVSAPLASVILSSCQAEPTDNYELQFFTEEVFAIAKSMMDTILPRTDSPSATDVGVHRLIDKFVYEIYDVEKQADYSEAFLALSTHLMEQAGEPFEELRQPKQLSALQALEQSEEETLSGMRTTLRNFKQQTIAFYLTTEEIGKNYLNYLPVPGAYEACISLEEAGGKAWTL